jgi:hypothetical protein
VVARRRVGFRTATLTTGNDTDTAWVATNRRGNGNAVPAHTLMFRINGAAVSMRGESLRSYLRVFLPLLRVSQLVSPSLPRPVGA